MRIAVTGHRPGKLGDEWNGIGYYSDKIRTYLQKIINEYTQPWNPTLTCISGMALGVDMIWAELAIENDLPFVAAIPCLNQEVKWSERQKQRYHAILNHPNCEKRIITPSPYNHEVMQIRNEWMVDNCNLLVGVWDGSSGGTGNCIAYALKQKRELVLMNPEDFATPLKVMK
jgi:uncharacterized phage-like protein YoqJ